MKVLYLDCISGISGDMFIAALLDADLRFDKLEKELRKLGLSNFKLEKAKVKRGALSGTRFCVIVKKDAPCRKLSNIESIIQKSRLQKDVKARSLEIFRNLARAEAKVHGQRLKDVHLHEVASVDSIVDIVGAAVALKELRIDKVYASIAHLGKGKTRISHGVIPIPAPGVLNLLKNTPVRFTGVKKELVTPTGAAILRTLASGFEDLPDMKITRTGYGAGSRELKDRPNMLRAVIGTASPYLKDTISVLETNIDDSSPQIFEPLSRRLFKAGALDVFLTPVFMKKYRPGILLTVLCKDELISKISSIIFRDTTSIGVRYYKVKRNKLRRVFQNVSTRYGRLRTKVSFAPGILKIQPEYEDTKRIAETTSIPLKKPYEEIIFNRR